MAGGRRQHLIQEIDLTIRFIQTEFRKKKKSLEKLVEKEKLRHGIWRQLLSPREVALIRFGLYTARHTGTLEVLLALWHWD